MNKHDQTKFTEEDLSIRDLILDHRVQRDVIDPRKIEKMKAAWNPDAVGRITVSRRENGDLVTIDGAHRAEAVRQLTDNAGTIAARVFEGLSLVDEAQMFLALNNTNQPKFLDKWKVRGTAEETVAVNVTGILRSFGWTVSPTVGDGKIAAVATLERVQALSEKVSADPNLVHSVIMVVTRAWGHDRYAVQGSILDGLARLIAEHGSARLDLTVMYEKLRDYKGGPQALLNNARQMASIQRIRLPFAMADLMTEIYNKGTKKAALPPWRRRS